MSEITINKNNKSISFTHNNIAFSQFGIADEILDLITDLQNQLQQKENIIKEVRERLEYLLNNDTIKINGRTYIKQEADNIITNYIKDLLDKGE